MHQRLRAINSLTKYPSILTYHAMNVKTGMLQEATQVFGDTVIITEKVDGTNARVIILPPECGKPMWLIGSREELFHARGDIVYNTALGLVEALLPISHVFDELSLAQAWGGITTLYMEVYGGDLPERKQYTKTKQMSHRLFDVSITDMDMLKLPLEQIASWRDHYGQFFVNDEDLDEVARVYDPHIKRVPVLGRVKQSDIPTKHDEMIRWVDAYVGTTHVGLDYSGAGEGVVLRDFYGKTRAKARLKDYSSTIRRREPAKQKEKAGK